MIERDFKDLGVVYKAKPDGRIPVVAFEKSGSPMTVQLIFNFGSSDSEYAGAVHFLEHMLVSGSKKYPSKPAIAEAFSNKGGSRNAYTNKDRMSLVCYLSDKDDASFAKEMFNEFLFNSLFDKETFRKERTAIIDEIRRSKSDFKSEVVNKIFTHRYSGTALEITVLGEIEDVSNIKENILKQILKEEILSAPAILAISGDDVFESGVDIAKDIEKKLKPIKQIKKALYTPNTGEKHFDTTNQTSTVAVSYTTSDSNESIAALIFASWKLFSQSGILIRRLRFENGLTYAVSEMSRINPLFSFTSAISTCSSEKIPEVVSIISDSFEKHIFEEINDDEISKCLNYIKKSRKRGLETASSWLSYANRVLDRGFDAPFAEDFDKKIKELGVNGLKKELKKYFKKENSSITIVSK